MTTSFGQRIPWWVGPLLGLVALLATAIWAETTKRSYEDRTVALEKQIEGIKLTLRQNANCVATRFLDCEVTSDDVFQTLQLRLQKDVYDSLRQGMSEANFVRSFFQGKPEVCDPNAACCLEHENEDS